MPAAAILPWSITMIRSALRTDAMRCATMIFVHWGQNSCKASYRFASVFKSRALAASSKIKISACLKTALAMEILCFCPPERLMPRSATSVSYPSVPADINPSAWAAAAAALISASAAPSFPHAMFSWIVTLNSSLFCNATATFSRRAFCLYSLTSTPSTRTEPDATS